MRTEYGSGGVDITWAVGLPLLRTTANGRTCDMTREGVGEMGRAGDNTTLDLGRVRVAALVGRARGFLVADANRYVWFVLAAAYVG